MPNGSMHLYFIADCDRRYVKIGISRSPENRLRDLQAASPLPLAIELILNDCSRNIEERLHHHFAKHWLHREWFTYDDEIKDRVAQALVSGFWSWDGIAPARCAYDPSFGAFIGRYEMMAIIKQEALA